MAEPMVDDADKGGSIVYKGDWGTEELPGWNDGSLHVCNAVNTTEACTVSVTFNGLYLPLSFFLSHQISLRQAAMIFVETSSETLDDTTVIFSMVSNLPYGQYTVVYGALFPTNLTYGTNLRNGITFDGYIATNTSSATNDTVTPIWGSMTTVVQPPAGWEGTSTRNAGNFSTTLLTPSPLPTSASIASNSNSSISGTESSSDASETGASSSSNLISAETWDGSRKGAVAGGVMAGIIVAVMIGVGFLFSSG
ncbi:hypothetical protein T439DRAFT_352049 [Meredithblackwellia eburnea MCA 4105]